jgi:hypothetical protein
MSVKYGLLPWEKNFNGKYWKVKHLGQRLHLEAWSSELSRYCIAEVKGNIPVHLKKLKAIRGQPTLVDMSERKRNRTSFFVSARLFICYLMWYKEIASSCRLKLKKVGEQMPSLIIMCREVKWVLYFFPKYILLQILVNYKDKNIILRLSCCRYQLNAVLQLLMFQTGMFIEPSNWLACTISCKLLLTV